MSSQTPRKVAVVGSGNWGTAIANLCADAGQDVTLWGRDPAVIDAISKRHENPKYLPGIALNPELKASSDLDTLLTEAEVIFCCIPTQQIRKVFEQKGRLVGGKTIVNTSKGIEEGSFACVSEIFADVCPGARYAILSGPSFALETAKRLPTAVTIAARSRETAHEIQRLVATPYFRAYTSQDVAGVELVGALKNVIAIASGIVSGLQLGYNAQAAVINRGIAEVIRMGKRKGAEPMTFLGLAGMGDLILTCTGPLSRNRKLGVFLGEGKSFSQCREMLGGVAEGYYTAKSAFELSKKLGVEMPLTEQVYRILYENSSPQQSLGELMGRDLKDEWEVG